MDTWKEIYEVSRLRETNLKGTYGAISEKQRTAIKGLSIDHWRTLFKGLSRSHDILPTDV